MIGYCNIDVETLITYEYRLNLKTDTDDFIATQNS